MARLTDASLKRLDEARERSAELSQELSDPATFGDARRAAELGREQVELAAVVERYERYQTLLGQIEQAEDLLNDGADDDMRALARTELEEVEPQIEDVVASL